MSYTVAQGIPSFNVDTSTAFEQAITLDAYNHQSVTYTDALGRDRYEQVFSGTGSPYTVVRTVQYNRDEVDNVISTVTFDATSKAMAIRRSAYDGLQQVTGWNDSDAGACSNTPMPASCSSSSDTAWKATYDADGNTLSQTDPRGVTTYKSYDVLDRLLCSGATSAQVNPCQNSAYATYFYDSYDNSSNSGVTFPSGCTAPGGTSSPVGETVAETFSRTVGSGWRCNGYDARGQNTARALSVTADSQTTTQNVLLGYNDTGDLTNLTYPDGEIVAYNYDSNDYFRGMSNGNGQIISAVHYANTGQVAGMTLGGVVYQGAVTTPVNVNVGYDTIQRPTSESVSVGGTTLLSQTQTYDNIGNVLQLSTTLPTSSGGSLTDNQSFCYDALNRLVWAGNAGTPTGGDHCGSTPGGSTTPAYSQSFAYDALNRITQGPTGTVTYGDTSHPHAATGLSSIPNQYASYDVMGNMTCRNVDTTGGQSCASGSQTGATMTYDNEGRLASWTASGGTTGNEQYLYDNEGNRVLQRGSTTSGGSSTVTDTITFDEYTDTVISNGTTSTTKYYSAGGQRVAEATGTAWYYLISDLLGSTVLALKGDGTFQAAHLFAPYGQTRYSDGTIPTAHNFTGQRLDVQTGLLYYGARYYDAISGAFTSTDSVQGNDHGIDTYGYAYGNPETYSDPTGHMPFPDFDPEAWQEFWRNLVANAPGLALWFLLSFPPPGGTTLPPINGSSLQGPPASSYSSDTAPSDSQTIDPGTSYDAGKAPEKGGAKDGREKKKDKRGSKQTRPQNDPSYERGNQPSSAKKGMRGSQGWKYQVPSYAHPPVTIDITPVPVYIPPSVSQPYTPPVITPAPDPSWWTQAVQWVNDSWDQFTNWVSDSWEQVTSLASDAWDAATNFFESDPLPFFP